MDETSGRTLTRALVLGLAAIAILVAVVLAGRAQTASAKPAAGSLVGTGATFPFPLISKWIPAVDSAMGIKVTYSATGSGAGIAQITARTVDFGASDAPLSPDQLSACNGCVVIPWALAGMSIPYNLPGLNGRLRLNGAVLANIFLGNITKWNAAPIKALNPKLVLPDLEIKVVYRSDGSGSTYAFTNYLATVSPQWKSKVGVNTSVNFPKGAGARGSSGVAGVVKSTEGALTYVDAAYSITNKFQFALIQNRAGGFTTPGVRGVTAALCDLPAKVTALAAAQDRRSAQEVREEGISDLDVHVRDRSDQVGRQGGHTAPVRLLVGDGRAEVRSPALLRAASENRERVHLPRDQEDPVVGDSIRAV